MRSPVQVYALSAVLTLAACAGPEAPLAFCDGSVSGRYNPLEDTELTTWPDPVSTQPSTISPSGIEIAISPERTPWLAHQLPILQSITGAVNHVSGFARVGAVLLRFTGDFGPVPDVVLEPSLDDALVLLDLSTSPPTPLPFRTFVDEDGSQLRVEPLKPLASNTDHALVLRRSHTLPDGSCIRPAPLIRKMLAGQDTPEGLEPMAEGLDLLLTQTGWRADEISAATVFRTHAAMDIYREIQRYISEHAATWATRPQCSPETQGWQTCEGTALLTDFRDERGDVSSAGITHTYRVPVHFWLPPGEGNVPLMLYAHGIGDDWYSAREAVQRSREAELPFAVVAMDALQHGDHPTHTRSDDPAFAFLGVSLSGPSGPTIDAAALRGNFLQTNLDRLQVIELLLANPDVDGDGRADFDTQSLHYWGVSLGGMLSSGLLALTDAFDSSVMSVGGGNLIYFATQSLAQDFIGNLLEQISGGPDALQRNLVVAQSAADPADPSMFAAHVYHDRLDGSAHVPDVLLPIAMHDEVVAASCGHALARALGLTYVAPAPEPILGLPLANAPYTGEGDRPTAAVFEFDQVTPEYRKVGDPMVEADHSETPFSQEGKAQWRAWFEATMTGQRGVVIDPYQALGTGE